MQSATPRKPRKPSKPQYFTGRVTVQYGSFEASNLFLVKAKNEAEARSFVETVIKADNIPCNGGSCEDAFSWFGHGTDEVGVHENFRLRRITQQQARTLATAGRVQYVNDCLPDARQAISEAEAEPELEGGAA